LSFFDFPFYCSNVVEVSDYTLIDVLYLVVKEFHPVDGLIALISEETTQSDEANKEDTTQGDEEMKQDLF